MANFYEAFARGQANGLERQNAITQRNMLAELQTLAPQVMAGDLDATSRAYALDPKRAEAYQSEGNRQQQQLVGLAKTLKQYADNPQMQAGVYRSALPYLKRNFGAEIPDQFDAATVMPIVDQVLSVANNTPNFNGQTPTDVRSFQMMTQGLSPEDVERARRVQLGLEGRASNAGYGFFEFQGADGLKRMGRNNPRTGSREVYDESTGEFVPLGSTAGMGAVPQASQQAVAAPAGGYHFAAFSQLATEFPSVTMTSGVRSAERNAQVGGQPNSQHLNGTAADYAVPANQKPAFISRARQLGYQAIDEGDHIHLQMPRGAGGGANLFAGRRPEDEAAAVEAAKLGTQQQFLPQELAMRTQAAIQQAGGSAQAKGEAEARLEAIQGLPRVMQESTNAINLIDKALSHPGLATAVGASGRTDPRNYIPGTDATDFRVLLDQIKGGTFLQAFQSLKGGGAITEVEGTKAEQAIARLNRDQSEAAFRQSLQDLRDVAQAAITRAQTKAQAAGGAPAQMQPQGAPRQIQSAAEYNALPSGALFIAPDGTQRRKR